MKSIHSRKRKLVRAVVNLAKEDLFSEKEFIKFNRRIDKWYEDYRKKFPSKKRGRPNRIIKIRYLICFKDGCDGSVPEGQKYCSKEHAPLGLYR